MTRISRIVPATSEDWCQLSEDFRTLPQNVRRFFNDVWALPKLLKRQRFDFIKTQKRDTKSSLNAFLDWIFNVYHVVKNNLSGFASAMRNWPWCVRSMSLVHRHETHAECVRVGRYNVVVLPFSHFVNMVHTEFVGKKSRTFKRLLKD